MRPEANERRAGFIRFSWTPGQVKPAFDPSIIGLAWRSCCWLRIINYRLTIRIGPHSKVFAQEMKPRCYL
jgi:hypothetical protein